MLQSTFPRLIIVVFVAATVSIGIGIGIHYATKTNNGEQNPTAQPYRMNTTIRLTTGGNSTTKTISGSTAEWKTTTSDDDEASKPTSRSFTSTLSITSPTADSSTTSESISQHTPNNPTDHTSTYVSTVVTTSNGVPIESSSTASTESSSNVPTQSSNTVSIPQPTETASGSTVTTEPSDLSSTTTVPTEHQYSFLISVSLFSGRTMAALQLLLFACLVVATNGNAIPTASPISSDNPKYGAYMDVVNLLKGIVNTSVNPCDDFYAFTCGNFNANMSMSFDVSDNENFMKMARQLKKDYYLQISPLPVQQTAWYFQACRTAQLTWNGNSQMIMDAINGLLQFGVPFPMLNQTANLFTLPTATQMGSLVGYLAGTEGIYTLLSPYVDTNWKDPHGPNGYALYVDQPSTIYQNTYYRKAWDVIKAGYLADVIKNMKQVAKIMGVQLDADKLASDANDIIQFEYKLAMGFSTDDTTRRNYQRSYNPMNRVDAQSQYSFIDWRSFLAHAVTTGGDDVYWKVVHDPAFNFILMEPAQLIKLQNALTSGQVSPRTVVNYLFYRLVDQYSNFFPPPNNNEREREAESLDETIERTFMYKPVLGKPRHIKSEERKFKRGKYTDDQELDINCAGETMQMMQYSNARAFIDNIYPTADARAAVRANVGKLIESILIGFRSMIDQLSWMSRSTKGGAYSKIDNLVKNIAFPDWIADDALLTAYYAPLTISKDDDYFAMFKKANTFNLQAQFLYLLQKAGSNRIDFNGPPGTTNAWYQPEMNSITFPAAILRQPFYDPNWPAAMNFGSMGVIAGHELTHGFDDEGVQWDGTGALNGWMDEFSNYYFHDMADCVVQEYSNFCPLQNTSYASSGCIDGAQTQGENIADNGGIHSAFRAYKNYINFNGPDPLLPDAVMGAFTADQLFFMSFAQVWCQMAPAPSREFRQILVDVHSPSLYRVFGTIQNFPAFKTAFNCPYNSKYAPEKHCNVWVSDLKPSTGIPQLSGDLNLPTPAVIEPRNLTNFNAYKEAVDFFSASVDFTKDPCNDFYKYSCGKYNKQVSFHFADEKNKAAMAAQLMSPAYQTTINASTALTKTSQFFKACQKATPTMNDDLKTKNLVMPMIQKLGTLLGSQFNAVFNQNAPAGTAPSATQLADALSYLSFDRAVDTVVSPLVDTKWKTPTAGYILHIDQNTAFWSKSYYQGGAWNITLPNYMSLAKSVMNNFAQSQSLPTLNDAILTQNLNDVFAFERLLATKYSTDDNTRRQYNRSWNNKKISELNTAYPFIDWLTYFSRVPAVATPTAEFVVNVVEDAKFTDLSTDWATIATPNTLANYLHLRLLLAYSDFVPTFGGNNHIVNRDWQGLGRQRNTGGQREILPQMNAVSNVDSGCAGATLALMQNSNGRVFIDYLYPNQQAKDIIRNTAGGLISNVINAFQSMLDGLDWMDATSKLGAYQKVLNIKKNIAFPDWITDNTKLDAYYKPLDIQAADDYYVIMDKLTKFNLFLQYNQLNAASTDRSDFLGQPGTVNAWYQPELNSITFPAGILRPPYFNPNWPASLNYGGMGLVAGHELTHGFDDEGVQWDGTGVLKGWMTDNSTAGFKKMAQCVIDEYSGFCPLKGTTYSPQCINGQNTQGENIADNGGIHSAFRAYRNHIALNGPDPLLNDRVFGQFTHDQLFFMNFGQVWCQAEESPASYFKQIMVDPHSPANYRVFGTIQNYPAFRTAFNCPVGSSYAPQDHCKVWVPNMSP